MQGIAIIVADIGIDARKRKLVKICEGTVILVGDASMAARRRKLPTYARAS